MLLLCNEHKNLYGKGQDLAQTPARSRATFEKVAPGFAQSSLKISVIENSIILMLILFS